MTQKRSLPSDSTREEIKSGHMPETRVDITCMPRDVFMQTYNHSSSMTVEQCSHFIVKFKGREE